MAREATIALLRERIVAYAASHIGRDLAEDLAQEVLMVLHDKYAAVESIEELLPLSLQILRFKMVATRRKSIRRGETSAISVDEIQLPHAGPNPEREAEKRELLEKLKQALPKLGDRCREMFRLKLLGRTFAEIQIEMKAASINTVYTWDARCRQKLKELLDE